MIFAVEGEGRAGAPSVLVHGFLGSPEMWSPVVRAAGAVGPVARAWLPGHGPRPWYPEGEGGFEASVDALVEALPWRAPCLWVAYSMGARVALSVCLRHPARALGAVLVGAHPGLDDPEERAARARWEDGLAARVREVGLGRFVDEWEALPVFDSQRGLGEARRAQRRVERLGHTEGGIAWALVALGLGRMPSYQGRLARCEAPLTAVAGALDTKFVALGRALSERVPRGTFVAVEGAGHDVALEAPEALAGVWRAALGGAVG